ncbi:pentapeptide repeat-containing protein [Streptomyces sp. NPDC048275]|uniref:pentapeptide repeat-containing protein n=1 Tax=Streptomyces sp. NPDC048275 TaxID=3155629 RepID=UPI0033FCEDB3
MSTPLPPSWSHCGHGADPATDPIGCRGIHVSGHTVCLAHLTDIDRTAYLTGLTPGAGIDHRGTPFTQDLLVALLYALQDPSSGEPHLGRARFDEAQFFGAAVFDGAQFAGDATFEWVRFPGPAAFNGAQFSGGAQFVGTEFSGDAGFEGARFTGDTEFGGARFSGEAQFRGAHFSGGADFDRARFSGEAQFVGTEFSGDADFAYAQFSGVANFQWAQFSSIVEFLCTQFSNTAWFSRAQFSNAAWFEGAQFSSTASFFEALFENAPMLGPLVCAGQVVLSGAAFVLPATLEIAAEEVVCERTRWESTATVRVRYAAVDLSHAVLTAPAAVIAHSTPFTLRRYVGAVSEDLLVVSGARPRVSDRVRVVSVQGVDAAHLVLSDVDLADCLFSGAFHLDQIRLEGRTTFADVPTRWRRRGIRPIRWTRRRVLAEEHHWRAHTAGQPALSAGEDPEPHLWRPGPHHIDPARTPDPEDVAALYRQLRKAFEDGKNEPGAADFYYGECEMRRHDGTGTTQGERRLLWGYWLLSGYGLRASRAFTWLLAAMSLTVLLLMGLGLPTHDPDPATTGTLHGSKISLNTSTPGPALRGGWPQRMTWVRAERAARIAVNSVVFRSSGQNLTTAGTYIEMTSRLLEPTLLALASPFRLG